MKHLAPLGGVYQAGTFSGNPVVMKAGLAALRLLSDDFYAALNKRCAEFTIQVNDYLRQNRTGAHVSSYHSMMSFRFREESVANYEDALAAAGGERYKAFFHHMLRAGIYLPPADLEAFFISGMHTAKDLKFFLQQVMEFFKD